MGGQMEITVYKYLEPLWYNTCIQKDQYFTWRIILYKVNCIVYKLILVVPW